MSIQNICFFIEKKKKNRYAWLKNLAYLGPRPRNIHKRLKVMRGSLALHKPFCCEGFEDAITDLNLSLT